MVLEIRNRIVLKNSILLRNIPPNKAELLQWLLKLGYQQNSDTGIWEAIDKMGNETRPIQEGKCYQFDDAATVEFSKSDIDLSGETYLDFEMDISRALGEIFAIHQWDDNDNRLEMRWTASNTLAFYISNGTSAGITKVVSQAGKSTLRFIFDGSLSGNTNRAKIYLDGVLVTGVSETGTIPASLPSFTADFNFGEFGTVKANSKLGRVTQRNSSGAIIGQWNCDETGGDVTYDSSGNSINGVITNATLSTFHATDNDFISYQNEVGYTGGLQFKGSSYVLIPNVLFSIGSFFEVDINLFGIVPTEYYIAGSGNGFGYSGSIFTAYIAGGTSQTVSYIAENKIVKLKVVRNNSTDYEHFIDNISIGTVKTLSSASMTITDIGASTSNGFSGVMTYANINDASEFNFDEESGTTVADISGNGNDGILTGSDIDWVKLPRDESDITKDIFESDLEYSGRVKYNAKLVNSGYYLGDGTAYVNLNTTYSFTDGDKFFATFKMKTGTDVTTSQYFVSDYASTKGIATRVAGGLLYVGCVLDASNYRYASIPCVANTIYECTMTVNSDGSMTVTANGVTSSGHSIDVGDIVSSRFSGSTFKLFATGTASSKFTGPIGDVKIYKDDVLVGQYKCDESAGTIAYDSSGNGNDGTIAGAILSTFHSTDSTGKIRPNNLIDGFGAYSDFDGVSSFAEYDNSGLGAGDFYYKYKGIIEKGAGSYSAFSDGNAQTGGKRFFLGTVSNQLRFDIDDDISNVPTVIMTTGQFDDGDYIEFEAERVSGEISWSCNNITKEIEYSDTTTITKDYSSNQTLAIGAYRAFGLGIGAPMKSSVSLLEMGTSSSNITHRYIGHDILIDQVGSNNATSSLDINKLYIPAVDSITDAIGNTLTNQSDGWHNDAETELLQYPNPAIFATSREYTDISASTALSPASNAFNNILDDTWITTSGNTTGWIEWSAGEKIVTSYSIKLPEDVADTYKDRAPKNWTFEGYNGSSWDVLHTISDEIGWNIGEKRIYTPNNATAYTRYRLNITANNGDASFLAIGEIEDGSSFWYHTNGDDWMTRSYEDIQVNQLNQIFADVSIDLKKKNLLTYESVQTGDDLLKIFKFIKIGDIWDDTETWNDTEIWKG